MNTEPVKSVMKFGSDSVTIETRTPRVTIKLLRDLADLLEAEHGEFLPQVPWFKDVFLPEVEWAK